MNGPVPAQVPLLAVSVWPSWGVPVIVGGVELAGGSAATLVVGELVAVAFPAELVPVTLTRMVEPTSAEVRA